MRRRLEAYIPIVMLAVLVQLFAPIAAFRAAAAASDPLYMTTICSGMTSSPDTRTVPSRTSHDQDDCRVSCAVGQSSVVAIDPPPLIFVSLQRHYMRISWLHAADPMPAIRVGSNAQARAPPVFS